MPTITALLNALAREVFDTARPYARDLPSGLPLISEFLEDVEIVSASARLLKAAQQSDDPMLLKASGARD